MQVLIMSTVLPPCRGCCCRNSIRMVLLLSLLFTSGMVKTSSFPIQQHATKRLQRQNHPNNKCHISRTTTTRLMAGGSGGDGGGANGSANGSTELFFPENEFSRKVSSDRFLKSKKAEYAITITAEPSECHLLAHRFAISQISSLSADLVLRCCSSSSSGPPTSAAASSGTVEVCGTGWSRVTQRCVRTNEDFDLDLEFPIYAIVRPVPPMMMMTPPTMTTTKPWDSASGNDIRNKNTKSAKKIRKFESRSESKVSYRPNSLDYLDDMDVRDLQRMLQFDMNEDDIIEDEAIYTINGAIDVGELVSQLFWLKLDPYPKKPGSDPVQRSITG